MYKHNEMKARKKKHNLHDDDEQPLHSNILCAIVSSWCQQCASQQAASQSQQHYGITRIRYRNIEQQRISTSTATATTTQQRKQQQKKKIMMKIRFGNYTHTQHTKKAESTMMMGRWCATQRAREQNR